MQKPQTINKPSLPDPGQRVHIAQYGFQHQDGMTLATYRDRWGDHALVLMDDGEIKTCEGLMSGPGIGWHAGVSPSKTWKAARSKGAH
jgi:hypothetical protein